MAAEKTDTAQAGAAGRGAAGAGKAGGGPARRGLARAGAFSWRHRSILWRLLLLLLVLIVVLQNVETTTIDVLFWTIASVPKLVLMLGSMLLGALLWELATRAVSRRR